MRISIKNGNGALCDLCGKVLLPKDIIRIQTIIQHSNEVLRSTGATSVFDKLHICKDCYNKNFAKFFPSHKIIE